MIMSLMLSSGCNKDEFPDEFSIIGPWLENTTESGKIEIEFRSSNRAFLKLNLNEPTDTLLYLLDKKDELKLFQPEEFPDGVRTTHKLGYSQKSEELTIYGLVPLTPGSTSITVFKRK
jgi:hypothetical protein